jgi:hypothetical protein
VHCCATTLIDAAVCQRLYVLHSVHSVLLLQQYESDCMQSYDIVLDNTCCSNMAVTVCVHNGHNVTICCILHRTGHVVYFIVCSLFVICTHLPCNKVIWAIAS